MASIEILYLQQPVHPNITVIQLGPGISRIDERENAYWVVGSSDGPLAGKQVEIPKSNIAAVQWSDEAVDEESFELEMLSHKQIRPDGPAPAESGAKKSSSTESEPLPANLKKSEAEEAAAQPVNGSPGAAIHKSSAKEIQPTELESEKSESEKEESTRQDMEFRQSDLRKMGAE